MNHPGQVSLTVWCLADRWKGNAAEIRVTPWALSLDKIATMSNDDDDDDDDDHDDVGLSTRVVTGGISAAMTVVEL